jgi:8-oxo-dGTP pyrophosphatase MutT (NUDIX family)
VVLIRDRHIALIERIRPGRHYWVLPGGGIEAGESGAEAAIREAFEELGIEVAIVAHLTARPPPSVSWPSAPTVSSARWPVPRPNPIPTAATSPDGWAFPNWARWSSCPLS